MGMRLVATESFDDLLARLRLKEAAAEEELYARYVQRLVGLAWGQFDGRQRVKADPEDVVQSAFQSFYERVGRGEFELSGWDGLWGLLALITLRKCRDRRKRLSAQKRGVAGEHGWSHAVEADQPAHFDGEPTPEQAAVLRETVESWLSMLATAERSIVELGLQGVEDDEIARRLMRSQRTVRRVRQRVEERLAEMCLEG
jgi:RNA polymerase sigma-70 factor (ECF subfamily)